MKKLFICSGLGMMFFMLAACGLYNQLCDDDEEWANDRNSG